MKKILLFFVFYPFFVFPQSSEIKNLEKRETFLQSKINSLSNELDSVVDQIAILRSKSIIENIKEEPITSIAEKGSYLKDEPAVYGDIIMQLKEEKTVKILGLTNKYYQVCFDKKCGFMSEIWIKENEATKKLRKSYEEIEQRKLIAEQAKEKEKSRIASKKQSLANEAKEGEMLKKYGEKVYNQMKKGYIWIGMNEEMLRFTAGDPDEVHNLVGQWGNYEQWIYNNRLMVFLLDGKITSYQK